MENVKILPSSEQAGVIGVDTTIIRVDPTFSGVDPTFSGVDHFFSGVDHIFSGLISQNQGRSLFFRVEIEITGLLKK